MAPVISSNLGMQDFFTTTLSAAVTDGSALTIYLNNVPTKTEGYLVIGYSNSTKREIIFYNAIGANYVTCPADGRGQGDTTAQPHDLGADIRMNMVSGYWDALKNGQIAGGAGWEQLGTLTYSSVDGPTQVATITTDQTAKLYPGVRLQYQQTQALQNYWSFDTNNADSKGSATVTDVGVPTYTAGKFGNALTLNGSTQGLSITDAAAFKPTNNFSIGCWFKTSTVGTNKSLFSSFSISPNAAGMTFIVNNSNVLKFEVGNNTGPAIVSTILGTTNVTDGAWHYAVVSTRDNFTQIYLDGKLEGSGYTIAPAYAATNYVRIGCYTGTGVNALFFNGQIDDVFIAPYALDEETVAAKYNASPQTAQGAVDLTVTKYALVTDSSYANPTTTVTIYSGTDFTMMNSIISNAYYSTQKAPYGFPLGQEKWTQSYWVLTDSSQNTPTQNTWYNLGGSLSVPIGKWSLGYSAVMLIADPVAATLMSSLSTTNNTLGDVRILGSIFGINIVGTVTRDLPISLFAKQTYYLNLATTTASVDAFSLYGNTNGFGKSYIRATSTLL